MERVRVVLAGLPRMLTEIVQRVLAQTPEFEVIHSAGEFEHLMQSLKEQDPDVLVTGLGPGQNVERFGALLRVYPMLRIFALEGDGRRAVLYEMQPHTVLLGDVSPEGLIDAIRSAARAPNG